MNSSSYRKDNSIAYFLVPPAVKDTMARPPIPPDSRAIIVETVENVMSSFSHTLNQAITTTIQSAFEGFSPSQCAAAPSAHISDSQDPLFGMPAMPCPAHVVPVSELDLADKNILWTKISSARILLPLPLDSCCSVTLVSQNHASTVAKTHPNLKFTKSE